MSRKLSDEEVFEKYALVGSPEECWVWSGWKNPKGYGQFPRGGKTDRAHRLSYRLFRGEIPAGNVVRHTCDNPSCVNPKHLETGTIADNTRDRNERGRTARGSRCGRAKLTEGDVAALLEVMPSEPSDTFLAAQMGVSPGVIWSIRRGLKWRHVPRPAP